MAKTRTSFKKGEIHNPNGRPKREWTWAGELEKAVEQAAKDGRTIKDHVAESLIGKALAGDVIAIKEMMNRMDGMPKQDTNIKAEVSVEGVVIYKPEKNKE